MFTDAVNTLFLLYASTFIIGKSTSIFTRTWQSCLLPALSLISIFVLIILSLLFGNDSLNLDLKHPDPLPSLHDTLIFLVLPSSISFFFNLSLSPEACPSIFSQIGFLLSL